MTDQQPHTPTLAALRYAYVEMRYQLVSEAGKIPPTIEERIAEYDRGVAVIEAAAEQRGAEREMRDLAAHLIQNEYPAGHHAGIHTVLLEISARLLDRADQMEGDDAN